MPVDEDLQTTIFRHHRWANVRLFEACHPLSETQLDHSDAGMYGSIRATLSHLVRSEERYLYWLTGEALESNSDTGPEPPIPEMMERIRRSGDRLLQVAAAARPGRRIQVGEGEETELIPEAIFLLQAIYHAHEHRAQVASLLGQLGIEPPGLSSWTYYDEVVVGRQTEVHND